MAFKLILQRRICTAGQDVTPGRLMIENGVRQDKTMSQNALRISFAITRGSVDGL